LSSHLYLGLPLGLVVKGFHLNIFLAALASGILCIWPNQLSLWALMWLTIFWCFYQFVQFFIFNPPLHVQYKLKYETGNKAAATEYSWVFLGTVGFITARTDLTFRNTVIQIYKSVRFLTALLCSPSSVFAASDIYLLCKFSQLTFWRRNYFFNFSTPCI